MPEADTTLSHDEFDTLLALCVGIAWRETDPFVVSCTERLVELGLLELDLDRGLKATPSGKTLCAGLLAARFPPPFLSVVGQVGDSLHYR